MKKYVSPSMEEIKLTGIETITDTGDANTGDDKVNVSGGRT